MFGNSGECPVRMAQRDHRSEHDELIYNYDIQLIYDIQLWEFIEIVAKSMKCKISCFVCFEIPSGLRKSWN